VRLAQFILENLEPILDEWADFAKGMAVSMAMDRPSLRDHARGILETIAADLQCTQTASEGVEKSKGKGPPTLRPTEAERHGQARVEEGFSVNEAMAEFRSLRASVLRLWGAKADEQGEATTDIMRFNEAIDQALTESLARFSDVKDQQARLFDALLSTSPDLSYIVSPEGRLIYANKAFGVAFGQTGAELGGTDFLTLLRPFVPAIGDYLNMVIDSNSTYCGELPVAAPGAANVTYEYLLMSVLDQNGRCEAVAGTARDINERKAAEERVRHSANYDALTDLPNRSLFRERLELDVKHAARTGFPLALLYIDLDGFKGVNDSLGHGAGDQLLQLVAARINASVRDTDTVARLGGDEFTVILTEVTVPAHIDTLAGKILAALEQPFKLRATQVSISASIGIALYPADGATPDEMVRHADAAMYIAKHAGRNRYRFYRPTQAT
jgi:diguanylate cyclase (GGDEF)-like protein/PAS domain S-box-containing protein